MAVKSTISAAKFSNKDVAIFERKRVFGKSRYYPKNEFAQEFITLKSAMAQQNRKRFIKCLSQAEIEIVENLGIKVTITLSDKK
jgi:hypothetical protein